MEKFSFFTLPLFEDPRGALVTLEFKEKVPFTPQRLYYIFNTKEKRGGHAHREEQELFVCIKGTFTAKIHDGTQWHTFTFTAPGQALYNDALVWHEFDDFSDDAVMLAISSTSYDPERKGYIMDFDNFLKEFSA